MKVLEIREQNARFDIREAITEAVGTSTKENVVCITYSHKGMVIFIAPNQKIENIFRDHERALLGSIGLAIGPYYKDILSNDEITRDNEFEKKRDDDRREAQKKREMKEKNFLQENNFFIKEKSDKGGGYQFSQAGESYFKEKLLVTKEKWTLYGKEDAFFERIKLLGSVMQAILKEQPSRNKIKLFDECIVKFEDLNEAGVTRQVTWDVISKTWFHWN